LANFGGPTGFDFRREDLAYTRGFDRIKFPLAITCMVALFTAIVYAIKLNNELKNLEYQIGLTFTGEKADPKNPQFWGMLSAVLRNGNFSESHFLLQEGGTNYASKQLLQDLVNQPVADRLRFVATNWRGCSIASSRSRAIYEDVKIESASRCCCDSWTFSNSARRRSARCCSATWRST
jgi:hypothetical protein